MIPIPHVNKGNNQIILHKIRKENKIMAKKNPIIKITVRDLGEMTAELYPDKAPITVENFLKLIGENFFEGLIFHRVIKGFMIQGGGYTEQFAEKHAASIKELADIVNGLFVEKDKEIKTEKLKLLVGHTPLQVFFGALLGVIVSISCILIFDLPHPGF